MTITDFIIWLILIILIFMPTYLLFFGEKVSFENKVFLTFLSTAMITVVIIIAISTIIECRKLREGRPEYKETTKVLYERVE